MYHSIGTLSQRLFKGARVTGWTILLGTAATTSAAEESLRGPDVTIIAAEEKVIYEYRQAGQLRMIKVVPSWGKPHYLVPRDPTKGFGDLERAETLLPSWVIVEF
tara:strand:- start:800 stop:1114 length:315 start_codon:yes stop_codon:yes gene_type:complete